MPKDGHFRHPGRWWQPCVTPYFADLGVGDMRGQPSRQYTSPPRRRWQAVSPRHSIPHPLGRPSPPIAYPSPLSALHHAAKQRKPCHRGTRTLNPLADRAAAPSKPNFHHPTADAPQGAAQHLHLRRGGDDDDDERRTFPPPRRWWQPCVAGYFADLGVGDMPGRRDAHNNRHPLSLHQEKSKMPIGPIGPIEYKSK